MTESKVNAAHEVGHLLLGQEFGYDPTSVSIFDGDNIQPIFHFRRNIGDQKNVVFGLSGWAGEAYLRSHTPEDERFNAARFAYGVLSSACGSGWPLAFISSEKNDLRDLLDVGVSPMRLMLPFAAVLDAGAVIHRRRELFWRYHEKLVQCSFLGKVGIMTLLAGGEWSDSVNKANEAEKLEHVYAAVGGYRDKPDS